jgi:hypothetical protein
VTRVIYRERIPSVDPRLGRHVNHDSEARRFAYLPRHAVLRSVRHERHIPILDQGALGSCTGNAGIGCLGTGPFYGTQLPDWPYSLDETGAVALYSDATAVDPYPGAWEPDDTGSDGPTIAKVLTSRRTISGYRTPFGLTAALDALQDWPLITGINWYQWMYSPDGDGLVAPHGDLAGGHEIVVDEYDDTRGWVGFSNSWGLGWGLSGRFYMEAEKYGDLLDQHGDVTLFVPATVPAPVPDDDDDHVFARAIKPWVAAPHIGANRRAASAAREWLKAKGL